MTLWKFTVLLLTQAHLYPTKLLLEYYINAATFQPISFQPKCFYSIPMQQVSMNLFSLSWADVSLRGWCISCHCCCIQVAMPFSLCKERHKITMRMTVYARRVVGRCLLNWKKKSHTSKSQQPPRSATTHTHKQTNIHHIHHKHTYQNVYPGIDLRHPCMAR